VREDNVQNSHGAQRGTRLQQNKRTVGSI
jgi:hypothetical protein